MTEQNEQNEPKRKRGRPPWTEEQRQAAHERAMKKREEKAIEQRRMETNYQRTQRIKKGKRYREGRDGPWSPEMRASNAATWAKKRKELDEKNKRLIAENPDKTKNELGIDPHWKPADGSDSGYYRPHLRRAMVGLDLPPINIADPEQVKERIMMYLDFCQVNDSPPNLIGLGNWLGVDRKTIRKWMRGESRADTHFAIIDRAMAIIEESLVSQVQQESKNPASGIFLLKSMFGYKEQQDFVIRQDTQNDAELSADEIRQRYLDDGNTVDTTFTDEEGGE